MESNHNRSTTRASYEVVILRENFSKGSNFANSLFWKSPKSGSISDATTSNGGVVTQMMREYRPDETCIPLNLSGCIEVSKLNNTFAGTSSRFLAVLNTGMVESHAPNINSNNACPAPAIPLLSSRLPNSVGRFNKFFHFAAWVMTAFSEAQLQIRAPMCLKSGTPFVRKPCEAPPSESNSAATQMSLAASTATSFPDWGGATNTVYWRAFTPLWSPYRR